LAAAWICAAGLLVIGSTPGAAAMGDGIGLGNGRDQQGAGEKEQKSGCWARGKWYREGAIIDLQALKGVHSLSVTPVLFACKNGTWVSAPSGK